MSADPTNPYAAPPIPADDGREPLTSSEVKARLRKPAMGLLASSLWGIALAVFFTVMPAIDKLKKTQLTTHDQVEIATGASMLFAFIWVACFIFRGGLAMLRGEDLAQARHGAILAMLPCGGAWIIGLPFGIWAWIVLRDPRVRQEFIRNRRKRSQLLTTGRGEGPEEAA